MLGLTNIQHRQITDERGTAKVPNVSCAVHPTDNLEARILIDFKLILCLAGEGCRVGKGYHFMTGLHRMEFA